MRRRSGAPTTLNTNLTASSSRLPISLRLRHGKFRGHRALDLRPRQAVDRLWSPPPRRSHKPSPAKCPARRKPGCRDKPRSRRATPFPQSCRSSHTTPSCPGAPSAVTALTPGIAAGYVGVLTGWLPAAAKITTPFASACWMMLSRIGLSVVPPGSCSKPSRRRPPPPARRARHSSWWSSRSRHKHPPAKSSRNCCCSAAKPRAKSSRPSPCRAWAMVVFAGRRVAASR